MNSSAKLKTDWTWEEWLQSRAARRAVSERIGPAVSRRKDCIGKGWGNMRQETSVIPFERIASAIWIVRGEKVMLDADLAALYGVETKILKRAVLRNRARFPQDFMFILDSQEVANLRCQIGTSSLWGGIRYAPMAFTEQGVAMLSGVLRSARAVAVNVAIMRTFSRLRKFLASRIELSKKMRELELKVALHDKSIGTLFSAMEQLTSEQPPAIGFQYVGTGDSGIDAKKAAKEARALYVTKRIGKRRCVRRGGK